ncbi:MAG: sodium:proton antiporter [archaeon]|nr:MAG: sodium:proton antiporter [archaeon]
MVPLQLVFAAFLAISLVASVVSRKTRTPYTILLVLIGIALTTSADPALQGVQQELQRLSVGGLFVGLVLPPLLFESMMSIRTEEFRAVSRPAIVLATVGVVVAAVVGGLIVWKFMGLPWYSAFIFGAIIAPTDVATVLEVFRRTVVPARLATLLETESVFNDATGIVLLTVFLASLEASGPILLGAVSTFIFVMGGGALIGLGVAWGARQVQREASDPLSQIVLTMAAVYGAYGLATAAGVSGLIAVAVTGLLYGNTVLFRIERRDTEEATRQFWGVLAFMANTVAFLFIGLSTNILSLISSGAAILIAYAVVIVARFASVYPILGVWHAIGPRLPWAWRNVAMIGGMRGALSIVLVSTLDPLLPGRDLIVNMTFGVVILSVLLQGPLLSAYASRVFGKQQTLAEATEEAPQQKPSETLA